VSGERTRWEEIDPWGHPVSCDEAVWATKTATRAELVAHETEIRATVRDPDRLYIDWESSVARALRGGPPQVVMVHYVSEHRAHGKQAGNLLTVVVKWVGEGPEAPSVRGYFTTAYLPGRLQRRLQLRWRRPE
jgi:hypothetical protein